MNSTNFRRKILALMMVVMMLNIYEGPVSIFAMDVSGDDNSGVQPLYTNLQALEVSFGVDQSNGDAVVDILTSFYSNTDYIVIKVDFQRKDPDGWYSLATARTRKDDCPADWETYITVKHGYYYRAVVTVKLYEDGEVVETVTLPSVADYY